MLFIGAMAMLGGALILSLPHPKQHRQRHRASTSR
jgi:hypothetical protein